MTPPLRSTEILSVLDDATRALVRLSAVITCGCEQEIRDAITQAPLVIPGLWVEELLLQSYLFAGFPRALNATREWRRVQPEPLSPIEPAALDRWRENGVTTCSAVYGSMYERLRGNIRALHPQLDDWMITEGYGKVLSRPGLDLARRELCIVAACAAAAQDRQLHSHLHGALNVGVAPVVLDEVIASLSGVLGDRRAQSVRLLWARVKGK